MRAAFRACLLASRALHNAAKVSPAEGAEMLAEAKRIDATADRLKAQLARITS